MTNPSVRHFHDEHVNDIYQDAVATFYRLDAMEYKSEYERAMTLKPYRDLLNSFDTAYNDGLKQGKLEYKLSVAKKLLAMGLEIKSIEKATGLTTEEIQRLQS